MKLQEATPIFYLLSSLVLLKTNAFYSSNNLFFALAGSDIINNDLLAQPTSDPQSSYFYNSLIPTDHNNNVINIYLLPQDVKVISGDFLWGGLTDDIPGVNPIALGSTFW